VLVSLSVAAVAGAGGTYHENSYRSSRRHCYGFLSPPLDREARVFTSLDLVHITAHGVERREPGDDKAAARTGPPSGTSVGPRHRDGGGGGVRADGHGHGHGHGHVGVGVGDALSEDVFHSWKQQRGAAAAGASTSVASNEEHDLWEAMDVVPDSYLRNAVGHGGGSAVPARHRVPVK
jgi:hypothetical protein